MATAEVIWRDSPLYEEARIGRVFNDRRPADRFPDGVVEATSVQDIVEAVKLAKQKKLRVSIRSGGHSWAAWSVRNNAILIDLGKFKCIELDEANSIVKVSPSTTGRLLNEYLGPRGKMFGGGHCPDVGMGGFLLQGGMGWNCKNWGWACEKIRALDVVTAEGNILHCDEKENSELLWAARGAGPGFPAIVTAFYLEVRKSFSTMTASTFMWPMSEYKAVMDWSIKIAPECDDSIEAVAVSLRPAGMKDAVMLAHFVTFQNSEEAAAASLKHINDSHPPGTIMEAMCEPTSIAKEYIDQALANPKDHRYTCDNAYIDNNADVTEVLRDAFTTLPEGTKAFTLWFAMNPCSQRKLPDMALSMQSDHYLALYTLWEDRADDARCQSWVRNVMAGVEKHSVGAYLGDSDFQVRRTKFWEDPNAKRLMELRRNWDPNGTICGYLDEGDKSGVKGLQNVHEWQS